MSLLLLLKRLIFFCIIFPLCKQMRSICELENVCVMNGKTNFFNTQWNCVFFKEYFQQQTPKIRLSHPIDWLSFAYIAGALFRDDKCFQYKFWIFNTRITILWTYTSICWKIWIHSLNPPVDCVCFHSMCKLNKN